MAPIREKCFSPPARRNANQPCIGQLRWYKKIKSPLPAEPACEKGKEALE